MILQALHELYQRRSADLDPAARLPRFGFEEKRIPFVIEIDAGGKLLQIKDTRETVGGKKVGRTFLVPQGVKKTSGIAANLLWDTAEYAFGVVLKESKKKPARVKQQHAAFVDRIDKLPPEALEDPGVKAVGAFLANDPQKALQKHPAWDEIVRENPIVSFQLHGDDELVCQRPAVTRNVVPIEDDAPTADCLITGQKAPIERLHPSIKGVWGAQTSGANIVAAIRADLLRRTRECGARRLPAPISCRSIWTRSRRLVVSKAPTRPSESRPPSPTRRH